MEGREEAAKEVAEVADITTATTTEEGVCTTHLTQPDFRVQCQI